MIDPVQVFVTTPVLEFLQDENFDDTALNYIDTLRPTAIRECFDEGEITTDHVPWRVTVHRSGGDGRILKIEQEVVAGGRGIENGADLRTHIDRGRTPAPRDVEEDICRRVTELFAPRGSVGCCLHIAIEDGNLDDESCAWCAGVAHGRDCGQCSDLADLLRQLTQNQRERLYSGGWKYWKVGWTG